MKLTIQSLLLVLCVILGLSNGLGGVQKKLAKLGVDKSMQRSIVGMSKSGLSHDHIVKNIQRHYPDKDMSEIHDIVIASNIAHSTSQARGAIKNKKKKNGKR